MCCHVQAASDIDCFQGSYGRVEQPNRAVEGMARTIMSCFESRHVIDVATGHPVVPWAIRHAAFAGTIPSW